MAKSKKIGTENIKGILKEALLLATPIMKALDDGRIELTELFSIVPRLMSIPKIVSLSKQALKELKDLNAEESRGIAQYFEKQFNIPSDELEGVIEEAVYLLSDSYAVVENGTEVFNRWQEWSRTLKTA